MRILSRRRLLVPPVGGYGLLYNWYATQEQITIEYGFLYNGHVILDERNITSSDDWFVPDDDDWYNLLGNAQPGIVYPSYGLAAVKLKETDTIYWETNSDATNELNFSMRGAGARYGDGTFDGLKWGTTFQTSTLDVWGNTSQLFFLNDGEYGFDNGPYHIQIGQSIRLCRTATSPELFLPDGTFCDDYVGNNLISYKTVKVGTLVWLAENLAETKYRNGDWIHGYDGGMYSPISNEDWIALTTEAMCYYDDLESNAFTTTKITSSDDWVVPTFDDYRNLLNSMDTEIILGTVEPDIISMWDFAGGYLKETGLTHWIFTDVGVTDEFGFKAIGSGERNSSVFEGVKERVSFLTSDIWGMDGSVELIINVSLYASDLYCLEDPDLKESANSLRLCNPTTALSEGATGTYTQNDGTIIPTVVINGVEWTMNLKETKWRDGSWIHGYEGGIYTPISNTDWSNLTIPGVCVYNDDINNI